MVNDLYHDLGIHELSNSNHEAKDLSTREVYFVFTIAFLAICASVIMLMVVSMREKEAVREAKKW